MGLKDETLDRLGILIPLHRTVLQSFGCRQFTNDIEVGKYIYLALLLLFLFLFLS